MERGASLSSMTGRESCQTALYCACGVDWRTGRGLCRKRGTVHFLCTNQQSTCLPGMCEVWGSLLVLHKPDTSQQTQESKTSIPEMCSPLCGDCSQQLPWPLGAQPDSQSQGLMSEMLVRKTVREGEPGHDVSRGRASPEEHDQEPGFWAPHTPNPPSPQVQAVS